MKSIVIQQPDALVIEERPIPVPAAGEVRVKISLAGICGSDSHIYRGHNPFAKYPRVIGHEFFGVIDAIGEHVEASRLGQRVSVDPVISCGTATRARWANLTSAPRWWCWAFTVTAASANMPWCPPKTHGQSRMPSLINMR